MWRRIVSHPWSVLVLLVIGAPGTVENVRQWVDILGVNVLTTLALMGLTAHVTAVGFQNWEPYRSWFRRRGLHSWLKRRGAVRVTCLTANLDTNTVLPRVAHLPTGAPSLIEFPYAERPRYSVEIPRGYRLEFLEAFGCYVPNAFAMWPGRTVMYVFADRPLPPLARCKVAVYWVGVDE